MTSTRSDQALALAMGTASVFLFDRGHPRDGAHVALATVDRDESPQWPALFALSGRKG
jgi:hypothetical protein